MWNNFFMVSSPSANCMPPKERSMWKRSQAQVDDDLAGIAWWNALSEAERAKWLAVANSARPKDAWEAFKRARNGPHVV